MKRTLLTLFAFCSIAASVFAEAVTIDGYIYELNDAEGTATFAGLSQPVENVNLSQRVSYNNNSYEIDDISPMAFSSYGSAVKTIQFSLYIKESCLSATTFSMCSNLEKFLGGGMYFTIIDDCLYTADASTLISVPANWAEAHTTPYPEIMNYTTIIGDNAFYSVRGIDTVVLPLTTSTIGANAFKGSSIKTIDIPDAVTEIQGYEVPQQLWQGTFNSCQDLTKVSLGRGITKLPQHMFGYCPALTTVECRCEIPPLCPTNICNLNDGSAPGTFPQNITLYVPVGCKDAYAAATGWNVFGKIEEKEFEPTPVILPDDAVIDGIGYSVISHDEKTLRVENCNGVENNVVIPCVVNFCDMEYSVTEVASYAFALYNTNNKPVKTITLPTTLRTDGVNYNYFYTQPELEAINIADNQLYSSLNGVLYSADGTTILYMPAAWAVAHNITNYQIANTCTTIEQLAFYKANGLDNITIPSSVRTIGISAFKESSIVSLNIPDTVTEMLSESSPFQGTFMNCLNLKSLTIGSGVPSIPDCALSFCPALTEVTSRSATPPVCPENVFIYGDFMLSMDNVSTPAAVTLYVPVGSKDAYAAATGWKQFGKIEEKDMSGISATELSEAAIYYSKGGIYNAAADDGTPVWVYSADGRCVVRTTFTKGTARAELQPGLYIIKTDSKATKIVVK